MIFFSRRLYDGYQPASDWHRQAMKTWMRLVDCYQEYRKVIKPFLPKSALALDVEGLHDAVVTSCVQRGGELTMKLDASGALCKWCGHQVTLRFSGVTRRVAKKCLVGQWWLYNELHLSAKSGFSLHVLLTDDDIQIDADDVIIEIDR
jgi:hypothetical protein